MNWLGMAVRPRTPRAELRERVLARAYAAGRRRRPWRPLAAAATVVLALGALAARSVWQLGRLRAEREVLAARATALRDTLDLVRRPGARVFHIPVVTDGRAGSVTIFADTATQRWLVTCNGLSPNAPGQAYQIWFVTESGMSSALVMPMTNDRPMIAAIAMPDVAVTGVAMSVEPERGSPEPSGPVLFKRAM